MNNNVIIKADATTGAVLRMSTIKDGLTGEMKEIGTVRVEQSAFTMRKGFLVTSKRSAFIKLTGDQIESLGNLLIDNATFPLPGKIVIKETLTPYVNKTTGKVQEPKRKGKDGEIITYQGEPVYMNADFTDNMAEPDEFLRESSAPAMIEEVSEEDAVE